MPTGKHSDRRGKPASGGGGGSRDSGSKYQSSFENRHKRGSTSESPPKLTRKRLEDTLHRVTAQITRITDKINKETKFYDDQIKELEKELKELKDTKKKRIGKLEAQKEEWERDLKNDKFETVKFLFSVQQSSSGDLDKTTQETVDKGYKDSQIERLLERMENTHL